MNEHERQKLSVIVADLNLALAPKYKIIFFVVSPYITPSRWNYPWKMGLDGWEQLPFDTVLEKLFLRLEDFLRFESQGDTLEGFEPL